MSVPCRICGCLPDVPGLCHAVNGGHACYRPADRPDHCSACSTWKKEMRERNPGAPLDALCAWHRAERADEAAARRGASVPGSYALRVHAARMRRKSTRFFIDSGYLKAPEALPPKEKDLPLSVT